MALLLSAPALYSFVKGNVSLAGILARFLVALIISWVGLALIVNVINAYLPDSAFETRSERDELDFENNPLVDEDMALDSLSDYSQEFDDDEPFEDESETDEEG